MLIGGGGEGGKRACFRNFFNVAYLNELMRLYYKDKDKEKEWGDEGHLNGGGFVAAFIFGVERDESQNEKIEPSSDDAEPQEDEDQDKGHIFGFIGEGVVLLQGHHVAEADSRQRDEAIIYRIEIRPTFVFGKCRRSACRQTPHS